MAGCRTPETEERAALVQVLVNEVDKQTEFVKVHAAEALIAHGQLDAVRSRFETELETATVPYSIGVHRVLARTARDEATRLRHVSAIRGIAIDRDSDYRVHAMESLAKLGVYPVEDRDEFERFIGESNDEMGAFARWCLALSGERSDYESLVSGLRSEQPIARLRTAYSLGRTPIVAEETGAAIVDCLEKEPLDSPARVYLLVAAIRHGGDGAAKAERIKELAKYLDSKLPNELLESGSMLGLFGDPSHLVALKKNLGSMEADGRIGAADGSLSILRRQGRSMSMLDWSIVIAFLVLMLLIGIYYSLSNQTRDEYLLGSRRMHPWAVGVSYFATMFSTITFLSWPGELIRHGPMMLASLVGFPIAIVVVNRWIIPHFMRLPVTSAYEILEIRLGLSVRLLGSFLFLLMRLFWMAVIVHTTTVEILIPVAGFDPRWAPHLAMVICLGTIVYTALGGFKAVVVTDVAQTMILLGATVMALITITFQFGGLGWIPTQWEAHWQRPVFLYDPTVRTTFVSAILAVVSWQVCTAGSDQMAIQRYLATRDVHAARRMYRIALLTNMFVMVFLAALGLSLLAYFRLHPEMLNTNQSIERDADQFFQQFVVVAMAPGVCGLVVAGLLSAAMDSLSSGINSSSSVVTVDFIERFHKLTESNSSKTARWTSWAIGIIVVGLSTGVGMVSGNLLEVTYKVVNLLTAPLFGIFFMALFVRTATPFGTWAGTFVGIVVVVLINYWTDLTGRPGISFIWGMPIALAVQIVVGMLLSLVPIGPGPRPMLPTSLEDIGESGRQPANA